jgi:hypothetical protein
VRQAVRASPRKLFGSIKEVEEEMLRICELAIIPLIILSGGMLESFFEHPILYTAVFFTTMLVCMVLATKE